MTNTHFRTSRWVEKCGRRLHIHTRVRFSAFCQKATMYSLRFFKCFLSEDWGANGGEVCSRSRMDEEAICLGVSYLTRGLPSRAMGAR